MGAMFQDLEFSFRLSRFDEVWIQCIKHRLFDDLRGEILLTQTFEQDGVDEVGRRKKGWNKFLGFS